MKLDLATRRSGKTTRAIRWLKEKPFDRVLIVMTESERSRLIDELHSFFLGEERIAYAKYLMKQHSYLTFEDAMEQAERFPIILGLLPIYTWRSAIFEHSLLGVGRKEVYIDNADYLLRALFPTHQVAGISMGREGIDIV